MIYEAIRYKDGEKYVNGASTRTIEDGIVSLFEFELAYGGRISTLNDNCVETTTHILGCRDVTKFSFTDETEKKVIYELLQIWNIVAGDEAPSSQEVNNVMKITKDNPLMIKLGSGLIIGRSRLSKMKLGIILSLMEEDENVLKYVIEKYADNIAKEKLENIATAFTLVRKEGMKPQEVFELLLAVPIYDSVGKIAGISM